MEELREFPLESEAARVERLFLRPHAGLRLGSGASLRLPADPASLTNQWEDEEPVDERTDPDPNDAGARMRAWRVEETMYDTHSDPLLGIRWHEPIQGMIQS